ncbi:L-threonine 3-dehydrogenase [Aureococcus anophagefferens]|nr:L-threonine 3-dehydrogenase [Aureococcus anophagefferens]
MLAKLARLNAPRVAARAAAPRALFSSDSVVDTITLTQKRSAVLRNASDADLEATKKAIANEQKRRQSTLIIGAAGAVGKRLCAALTQAGHKVIATDRTPDPGSDYGLQKRGCRELMADFAKKHNGDPRFAVLPGVLHSNSVWGNGTTEYALDALLSAPHQATTLGLPTGESYTCPVDPDVRMPMVFVDDLMRGLVALQEAEPDVLAEPENGYCIPGLSFSANELFSEIRKHYPGFGFRVQLDANMDKFAKLWPDELATEEPLRDLGYKPEVGLEEMVATWTRHHDFGDFVRKSLHR